MVLIQFFGLLNFFIYFCKADDPTVLPEAILGYTYPNMKPYVLEEWATRQQSNIETWFWKDGKYQLGTQCGNGDYSDFNVWDWSVVFQSLVDAYNVTQNSTYSNHLEAVYTAMDAYYNKDIGAYAVTTKRDNDIDYDDNAQIASAFITAYDNTGNEKFLKRAQTLLDFLVAGWNKKRGGVTWAYTGDYIATISTTESALAALRMYETGKNTSSVLTTYAANCFDWLWDNMWDEPNNMFYDGMSMSTSSVNHDHYSYHMGTALSLASHLYYITHNGTYGKLGHKLALASIDRGSPMFRREYADNFRFWYDGTNFTELVFQGFVDYINLGPRNLQNISFNNEVQREIRYIIDATWDPTNDGYFFNSNPYQNSQWTTNIWNTAMGTSNKWTAELTQYCLGGSNHRPQFRLLYEASTARALWLASQIIPYV